MFSVKMKGKCFSLDLMDKEQATYHASMRVTNLWHKRSGHFHHAAIMLMQKHGTAQGFDPMEDNL